MHPLASWCDDQRQHFIGEGLDQSMIDKLTRIGFDFYGSSAEDGGKDGDASKSKEDIPELLSVRVLHPRIGILCCLLMLIHA